MVFLSQLSQWKYQHEAVNTNAWNASIKALVESKKVFYFSVIESEYKANTKGSSAVHINSRHKEIKFSCDLWHNSVFSSSELKNHTRGLRFMCDNCTANFSSKSGLNHHIQFKHEGDYEL